MTKFTKVWFDEALGDIVQREIPLSDIYVDLAEPGADRTTIMRLTREELVERYGVDIKTYATATPEIWYSDRWNLNADFNTVANLSRDGLASRLWEQSTHPAYQHIAGQQVGKPLVLADIQRAIESISKPPAPFVLIPQRNYDLLKEVGDREAWNLMRPRPPAAAKSRAALHPLVGRLIDNLNKEN